jgi:hypothetical protein
LYTVDVHEVTNVKENICIRILQLDLDPWEIASQFVTFQIHFFVRRIQCELPCFSQYEDVDPVNVVESPFSFNHISNIKILNAVRCSISLWQRVEYRLQFKAMEDLLLCDPVGVLIPSYANL